MFWFKLSRDGDWSPHFLFSVKVQMMEPSVSGRLKLADVLDSGRLVKLLTVLLGTRCLIFISWLSLRKYGFINCEGSYLFVLIIS